MKLLKAIPSRLSIAIAIVVVSAGLSALAATKTLPLEKDTIDIINAFLGLFSSVSGVFATMDVYQSSLRKGEGKRPAGDRPRRGIFQREDLGKFYYQGPSIANPFLLMEAAAKPQEAPLVAPNWPDLLRATVLNIPGLLMISLAVSFALIGVATVYTGRITFDSTRYAFWGVVILFGLIGTWLGWAEGIIISFSALVAISIIGLVRASSQATLLQGPGSFSSYLNFAVQAFILFFVTLLAFQRIKRLPAGSGRLQDKLLGFVIWSLNGYFIAGTVLFLLVQNGFDAGWTGTEAARGSLELLVAYSPPYILAGAGLYVALLCALVFLLVVLV